MTYINDLPRLPDELLERGVRLEKKARAFRPQAASRGRPIGARGCFYVQPGLPRSRGWQNLKTTWLERLAREACKPQTDGDTGV